MRMFKIGCHLSASEGYLAMGKTAVSIDANVFQFFTRNPRGGAVKALDEADIRAYNAFAAEHGIQEILAHAPYTLNPCSNKAHLRQFAGRPWRRTCGGWSWWTTPCTTSTREATWARASRRAST